MADDRMLPIWDTEEWLIASVAFMIGAGTAYSQTANWFTILGSGIVTVALVIAGFKLFAAIRWKMKDSPVWMGHRGSKMLGYQQASLFQPALSHPPTHHRGYEIQKDEYGKDYVFYDGSKSGLSGGQKWLTKSSGWGVINWPHIEFEHKFRKKVLYNYPYSKGYKKGYVPAAAAA